MAQTFDDAARDAARELRIRIERDLAAGRYLPADDEDAAAKDAARGRLAPPRRQSRGFRLSARRA